jgi:DNA-binding transcriptional ArsR family regulator
MAKPVQRCRLGNWRLSPCFRGRTIYSQLAMQYDSCLLDLTFRALSDRTRRSMIHALARGEARSASELGRRFRSAQPTISKHLKVLEQAGLVERRIEGRVHRFQLRRRPLRDAERWIARHQAFWTGAVDQLERLLSEAGRDGS